VGRGERFETSVIADMVSGINIQMYFWFVYGMRFGMMTN